MMAVYVVKNVYRVKKGQWVIEWYDIKTDGTAPIYTAQKPAKWGLSQDEFDGNVPGYWGIEQKFSIQSVINAARKKVGKEPVEWPLS